MAVDKKIGVLIMFPIIFQAEMMDAMVQSCVLCDDPVG